MFRTIYFLNPLEKVYRVKQFKMKKEEKKTDVKIYDSIHHILVHVVVVQHKYSTQENSHHTPHSLVIKYEE
jgi:hypothetical protein